MDIILLGCKDNTIVAIDTYTGRKLHIFKTYINDGPGVISIDVLSSTTSCDPNFHIMGRSPISDEQDIPNTIPIPLMVVAVGSPLHIIILPLCLPCKLYPIYGIYHTLPFPYNPSDGIIDFSNQESNDINNYVQNTEQLPLLFPDFDCNSIVEE